MKELALLGICEQEKDYPSDRVSLASKYSWLRK
jgi:hypothetical protein